MEAIQSGDSGVAGVKWEQGEMGAGSSAKVMIYVDPSKHYHGTAQKTFYLVITLTRM